MNITNNETIIPFQDVIFNKANQTMTIINGTTGTYSLKAIKECAVVNEDAKYHGKEKPFAITVSTGPLPVGLFTERSFFVGLKVTLKDDTVLAIYTSKTATRNNTDLHKRDTQEAKRIKKILDQMINDYKA